MKFLLFVFLALNNCLIYSAEKEKHTLLSQFEQISLSSNEDDEIAPEFHEDPNELNQISESQIQKFGELGYYDFIFQLTTKQFKHLQLLTSGYLYDNLCPTGICGQRFITDWEKNLVIKYKSTCMKCRTNNLMKYNNIRNFLRLPLVGNYGLQIGNYKLFRKDLDKFVSNLQKILKCISESNIPLDKIYIFNNGEYDVRVRASETKIVSTTIFYFNRK